MDGSIQNITSECNRLPRKIRSYPLVAITKTFWGFVPSDTSWLPRKKCVSLSGRCGADSTRETREISLHRSVSQDLDSVVITLKLQDMTYPNFIYAPTRFIVRCIIGVVVGVSLVFFSTDQLLSVNKVLNHYSIRLSISSAHTGSP